MMKMEYIIIQKQANDITEISSEYDGVINIATPLKKLLEECFGETQVTENIINVEHSGTVYGISYSKYQRMPKDEACKEITYTLSLSLNNDDFKICAEVLEYINTRLNDLLKNKYFIILSFDGVSENYCNELFPILNKFERLLRNLVFKMLTKMYGSQWFEKTQTEILFQKLKEIKMRNDNKLVKESEKLTKFEFDTLISERLIQDALYEMTLYDIQHFLFDERSNIELVNLINKHLSSQKLKQFSKDDIIELIEKNRPQSLWDKHFADRTFIKGSNLKSKLQYISRLRNNVAHNKNIYSKDCLKLKEILNEFIPLVEKAIALVPDTQSEIYGNMINKLMTTVMAYMNRNNEQLSNFKQKLIDLIDIDIFSKSIDALTDILEPIIENLEDSNETKEETSDV